MHLVVLDSSKFPCGVDADDTVTGRVAYHFEAVNDHIASIIRPRSAGRGLGYDRPPPRLRDVGNRRGRCAGSGCVYSLAEGSDWGAVCPRRDRYGITGLGQTGRVSDRRAGLVLCLTV